ncbi:MAG: AAA family ATPase, partial [Pirellulales bacterium]|nr:AAA family ATPase [Pirellulales bacterium]
QRQKIWNIHLKTFGIDVEQPRPTDDAWTGAEIRSCCRLAALLDVPLVEAALNVVPVARTAAESVERLRSWASGRCLDADNLGIYQRSGGAASKRRRTVVPKPSKN